MFGFPSSTPDLYRNVPGSQSQRCSQRIVAPKILWAEIRRFTSVHQLHFMKTCTPSCSLWIFRQKMSRILLVPPFVSFSRLFEFNRFLGHHLYGVSMSQVNVISFITNQAICIISQMSLNRVHRPILFFPERRICGFNWLIIGVIYSSCEKEIPMFFRIVIEFRLNNKSELFWKQFHFDDNRRLSSGQSGRHRD